MRRNEKGGSWYGGVSWDLWLMLLRHTGRRPRWFEEISRLLTEEERRATFALSSRVHGVKITAEGRYKYVEAWAVNHPLYPDIDAPEPGQPVPTPSAEGGAPQ